MKSINTDFICDTILNAFYDWIDPISLDKVVANLQKQLEMNLNEKQKMLFRNFCFALEKLQHRTEKSLVYFVMNFVKN